MSIHTREITIHDGLRPAENLEIAALFLLQEPLHGSLQHDAAVLGHGCNREYRQNLLQDHYGVVDVHELSGLDALDQGL